MGGISGTSWDYLTLAKCENSLGKDLIESSAVTSALGKSSNLIQWKSEFDLASPSAEEIYQNTYSDRNAIYSGRQISYWALNFFQIREMDGWMPSLTEQIKFLVEPDQQEMCTSGKQKRNVRNLREKINKLATHDIWRIFYTSLFSKI